MLQAIRNRAQGIFAWVLLILIGVPFALWGIQNYFDSGREAPAAVVGDRDLFERDVNRVYEQLAANLPRSADFDETRLKKQALERLINEELIAQASRKDRLLVGDEAVRSFIQTLPYFQTDGKFDKEKYKIMLASQNLSAGQFADQVRQGLVLEQYQRAVSDSALAPDWQVKNFYRLKNQQREIEYLTVRRMKAEQPVSDEAIADYYQQHRADFIEPETVVVDYLQLNLEDLAAAVKPKDGELLAFYEDQKVIFTVPEQRRVSHILIAAEPGNAKAEQVALEKITGIRERILKGEDFAKLAKEASEDTGSAQQGGDLGVISKGMMDPNFEQAALALSKGAISEPVRTTFGYHLIKVTELTPGSVKSFDQAKPELIPMFQRHAADSRFYELGQALTETSFEHADSLEPAAKAINVSIQRSSPFTREGGEGIGAERAIRDAAFSDDVLAGKNSDLIELTPEKVAVIRLYERRPAFEKPLSEVKGEIVQRMQSARATEQTRAAAEELRQKLDKEGAALSALAKAAKAEFSAPAPFGRNTKDLPAALVEAVFSANKPSDRPVSGIVSLDDGSQVVFQLKSVIEKAPGADDKEMPVLSKYVANSSGQQELSAWLAELRKTSDVHIAAPKE